MRTLSGFGLSFTASLLIGCSDVPLTSKNDNDLIQKAANWCISGGPIYTAIDTNPTTEAIVVTDGVIEYTGSSGGGWCPHPENRHIDLKGGTLYPGLTDGHGHLLGIGLREMTLNLEGTASIEDLQDKVRAETQAKPQDAVIYGRGWIETHWPEGRFPNKDDLDAIATDRPIILERSDGHAVVVNSKALELANIDANTENPFGGAINKDSNGTPTGMLVDNAANLISELVPALTEERRREAYIRGAELYASRGWTSIHSMSVNPNDIPLLNNLAKSGEIKIRVYNSLDIPTDRTMQTMGLDETYENGLVVTRAIKLYADGALGSRGAALLAPYSDDPENEGLMTLREVQVEAFLNTALRNGIQVNTHAIGDKANRYVLQWYKNAFDAVPKSNWKVKDPRWRIEHSQIIHTDDIPLFAKYGIIPSMQPSHAIGDLHFAEDRLGKDRLAGGYAWRSLIDSGARIIGGSDAPVEVGDPRIEFYAATQRKDLNGYSNENWFPSEKVTPQEALKMLTIWPAYGAFTEQTIGTIAVGKQADFSAFNTDIMTASGPEILESQPLFTMVNGEMAYQSKNK
ncbi:hypothetical protein DES40_0647 [Litorimonas taeanensis]|uniref:Amidohydrolase 3 domain-containing protein n=1 Tax=Litorimonas taeanensis TaxID=568099 RepID=A0A420WJZ4_9PROT|nr:amidohydrolase [Litorimonas taeanensis]RKQ71334.1 hypothetical protein DES40_0647 [Litorimonas taeanensis]